MKRAPELAAVDDARDIKAHITKAVREALEEPANGELPLGSLMQQAFADHVGWASGDRWYAAASAPRAGASMPGGSLTARIPVRGRSEDGASPRVEPRRSVSIGRTPAAGSKGSQDRISSCGAAPAPWFCLRDGLLAGRYLLVCLLRQPRQAVEIVIHADSVAAAVRALTATRTKWTGTAAVEQFEHDTAQFLAQEWGINRYERITSPSLAAADEYWQKTARYWAAVRAMWRDIFAKHDRFSLKKTVDGKQLFELHFAFAEEMANGKVRDSKECERHARETIEKFLVPQ